MNKAALLKMPVWADKTRERQHVKAGFVRDGFYATKADPSFLGHAGHARYVILNAGLAGRTPRDMALIALVVRHLRKGTPDPAELGADARDGDADLLARCTLLLRLAEQLERGEDQSVRDARFAVRGRACELRLAGDDRLARWGLERRVGAEAFARVFGRRLELAG